MEVSEQWKKILLFSLGTIVGLVVLFVILNFIGFFRISDDFGFRYPSYIKNQIGQEILDELRTYDEKMVFITSQITLNKKESIFLPFGIKNTKQEILKYKVEIKQQEIKEKSDLIIFKDNDIKFQYDNNVVLQPNEARVIPMNITSGINEGTGMFKIIITDVTNGEPGVVYDSKSFFITVN